MSGIKFILISMLAFNMLASVQGADYLYAEQGADWPGTCSTGESQSPIDIDDSADYIEEVSDGDEGYFSLTTDYSALTVTGAFTKYSYLVDSASSDYGKLTIDTESGARVYTAQQFHFHAPSEHTFDGDHADLELHIVHLTEDSRIAVIGLFFDADSDDDNETIQKVIDSYGGSEQIDISDLVDDGILDEVFHYSGSLTNHPCTEGVFWIVTKEVRSISKAQLEFFTDEWAGDETFSGGNGNNRLVQARNGRTVYDVSSDDDDYSPMLTLAVGALISLFI
jgi:carbonic anhydrase